MQCPKSIKPEEKNYFKNAMRKYMVVPDLYMQRIKWMRTMIVYLANKQD